MNTSVEAVRTEPGEHGHQFIVKVNTKPVVFELPRQTGSQIKEAAIQQHVDIQADFDLFLKAKEGDEMQPIGDETPITLHEGMEFRCVAPDDAS